MYAKFGQAGFGSSRVTALGGRGGRDINSLNLLVIIKYFPLSRALGYFFKSSSGCTLAGVLTVIELVPVIICTDRPDSVLWDFALLEQPYLGLHCLLRLELGLIQTNSLSCDWTIGEWMTCYFTSFSIVFQSYQDDWRLIMNGCVQWNSVYG